MQLPESVTLANARRVRDAGVAELQRATGTTWVVDAGALASFDSALLSVLIDWQRTAKPRGVTVTLSQAGAEVMARLQRLATAYGLGDVLALPTAPHHP